MTTGSATGWSAMRGPVLNRKPIVNGALEWLPAPNAFSQ